MIMQKYPALDSLTVERLSAPIGIDCSHPRFAWRLKGPEPDILQTAYRITLHFGSVLVADTGIINSAQNSAVTIPGFSATPMTAYEFRVTVRDNKGRIASACSFFETGRMGIPFRSNWVEPEQESAASGTKFPRSAQYIRIPFELRQPVRQARIYISANSIYRLEINGFCPNDQIFTSEIIFRHRLLPYQTYDVTRFLKHGKNVFGVALSDGWLVGKEGTIVSVCQYGSPLGFLMDAEIEHYDATMDYISGEQGLSSDRMQSGWSSPSFPDQSWKPVKKADYPAAVPFSVRTGAFKNPTGFN